MSSFVAGAITQARVAAPPGAPMTLTLAVAPSASDAGSPVSTRAVSHWQDALATLVPAEVLVIHALALSLGTVTTGSGAAATATIADPTEMAWVFVGMTFGAFGLYVAALRRFDRFSIALQVAGGLMAATAFVLWTMIQPTSAFSALPVELSPFLRVMIAVGGATVLGLLAKLLAVVADRHETRLRTPEAPRAVESATSLSSAA